MQKKIQYDKYKRGRTIIKILVLGTIGFLITGLLSPSSLATTPDSSPTEPFMFITESPDSTAASGGLGYYTSIALDNNNYPHISYFDAANGDLKYAYKDTEKWYNETVDWTGNVGHYTSIALDANSRPHISYYDLTNGDLKYAYKDTDGWHTETVDSNGVGFDTSIALDANGYPHISYNDYTNNDLKYAYKDTDGWHTETVDWNGYVGYETSLSIGIHNYPHISYYDYTNKNLKYAYKDTDGWHIETVDQNDDVGRYTSIALDTSNYPHISYYDCTNDDLKYAYKNADGWHTNTTCCIGDVGEYTSIALDTSNYPHISYFDAANGDLKYTYMNIAGWHDQTVSGSCAIGQYSSITLDTSNYPHISCYDSTNDDLKYATPRSQAGYGWNYWTNPSNMYLIPLGKVGIGTNTPSDKLHVNGSFRVESNPDPYLFFVNTSSDMIGIGTNSPSFGLDIQGKDIRIYNPTSYSSLRVDIKGIQGRLGSDLGGFFFACDTNGKDVKLLVTQGGVLTHALRLMGNNQGAIFNEGGLDRDLRVESTGNTHMLFIDAANNYIGIGTSTPGSELDVDGTTMTNILQLDKLTAAPGSPSDGMVVYADGTSWNPGSSEGIYTYYNSGWHYLG